MFTESGDHKGTGPLGTIFPRPVTLVHVQSDGSFFLPWYANLPSRLPYRQRGLKLTHICSSVICIKAYSFLLLFLEPDISR